MRGWMMALAGLAGLFGATGVGLAAVGAHRSGSPNIATAAYFLLFHASALTAFCALALASHARVVLVAASMIAVGVILFSGELVLHALADISLVTRAAPIGGVLMIVGWLVAGIASPLALRHKVF